jgi:ATP-dependent DNA helicase RecG
MSSKLPINLEDLLRQRKVEGDRIEYKKGWNPDPITRTLCAFANDFENLGGDFLKELDLTEGRSTGIAKVLKVMKENGSPPPEFETDDDRSYFLIRLPAHPKAASDERAHADTNEKTSEKILTEIRNNRSVTIAELSELVGVTTRSVERNLKKLQESGLLERIGPAKGGHWVVREES